MTGRTRSPVRRIAGACVYLVYLLVAALLLVYLFAYRPYIGELTANGGRSDRWDSKPFVSPHTHRQLGSVSDRSGVHFTASRPAKNPGNVRLCALGDSNTAGDEVLPDLDYPSYLAREFDALGAHNVEVLNFANGWHGFGQVAVMWEEVARRFDCDAVLLLPYSFWWTRDTSFNHAGRDYPYYLHARYALHGEGVRRLEVSGATHRARFDRYHAFLPRWQYLRYDRQAPAIVRAMLPPGRELDNPFYHAADPRAEAYEIHRRLLAGIAGDGVPVAVLFEHFGDYERGLMNGAPANVGFARATYRSSVFPLMAPIWHRSGWGNQLAARSVLGMLVDEAPAPISRLAFSFPAYASRWDEPPPLDAAAQLTIAFGGTDVGVIVSVHDRNQQNEERHMATLKSSGIEGLLAVIAPGASVLDACLLPLRHRLAPGEEVQVALADGDTASLGRPRIVADGVAIWVLEVSGSSCSNTGPLHVPLAGSPSVDATTLVIGDNRIPGQWSNGRLRLGDAGQAMFQFTALGHHRADVRELDETGEVAFVFGNAGRVRRVTFARWRRDPAQSDVEVLVPPPFAIRVGDGHARMTARQVTLHAGPDTRDNRKAP